MEREEQEASMTNSVNQISYNVLDMVFRSWLCTVSRLAEAVGFGA
jgi:hypothetical protein